MTRNTKRFAVPSLFVIGVLAYALWPQPDRWTIFLIPPGDAPTSWFLDGMENAEDCESGATYLIETGTLPEGSALRCGYGCTFLRGDPRLPHCETLGPRHDQS